MLTHVLIARCAAAALATIALSACSAAGSMAPASPVTMFPATGAQSSALSVRPPWERTGVPTALRPAAYNSTLPRSLFISDYAQSMIDVFTQSGILSVRLTNGLNGPQGIAVDAAHNLWVANTNAQNILVFPEYSMTAARTIGDGTSYPAALALAADGTLYVANFDDSNGQTGSIAVYPPGSSVATRKLNDLKRAPYFVTTDPQGNVFADDWDSTNVGHVIEYVAGKQSGLKRLPINLSWPGGLKVDGAGDLLVVDSGLSTVTEYTEAGVPTGRKIHVGTTWSDIAIAPSGISTAPIEVAGAGNLNEAEGWLRTFPDNVVRAEYKDTQFVSPGEGLAFMPGQYSY